VRRITQKPWFGPKRHLGWGWTVQSWQGAVVTVIFVGLVAAALVLVTGPLRFVAAAVALAAFLVVALLTGDPPGGPSSRQ
jgi:hypothetical protein